MISGLEHFHYEDRLGVGTVQPGEQRALGTPESRVAKGGYEEEWDRFVSTGSVVTA